VPLIPPTIETLLMDESFINDCLNKDAAASAYWKAFRQSHPEYSEVLEEARQCVLAMHEWGRSTEIEEQWDKLQEVIGGQGGKRPDNGLRIVGPEDLRRTVRLRRAWIAGAAAIVAGAMVITGIWIYKNKQPEPPTFISISAPAGVVRECGLPDGSIVWLDAGSTIQYRSGQAGERGVILTEGQIFCKVKHDAAHPFSVHTPAGMDIKDIGTAFSVQSYRGLNKEVIKVAEGEVAIQKTDDNLQLLKANQGVLLDLRNGQLTRTENTGGADTSWVAGRIELNDVSFAELAIVLEKTFDIHVSFESPDLMKYKASTSFNRKDPVRDVLDALKLIYGITYSMEGRSLTLHGRPVRH